MTRLIASITLLFSLLNIVGCGFEASVDTEEKKHIVKQIQFDGSTISSLKHDCSPESDHHDQIPCDGECHHHGSCHCSFFNTTTNLLCPYRNANQGMSREQFYLSSYLDKLFRPPIA